MKVFGELEKAQLEQIEAGTATPAARGRMFMDIRNPLDGVPMVYTGGAWRPFLLGQSSATITQNSGKNVTVDWSKGTNQKIQLTDNCVIAFSNPQQGKMHKLTIVQNPTSANATARRYCYAFDMTDMDTQGTEYQPSTAIPMGKSRTYEWFYETGIVPGYPNVSATVLVPGSAALAAASGAGLTISPRGDFLYGGGSATPFNQVYNLYHGSADQEGLLGVRNLIVPSTTMNATSGVVYHPSAKTVFFSGTASPYIQGFFVGAGGQATGNAYPNPGTFPTGAAYCVAMHPTGNYVGVGHTTSPFMSFYPITQPGAFGTKIADPAALPASLVCGLDFCLPGDFLAVAISTAPYIYVYPFSDVAGVGTFGARATDPGSIPTGPGYITGAAVHWRPQGDVIAMAMSTAPYLYVVEFDRSTGTFGNSITVPGLPAGVRSVKWSPCGTYLVLAMQDTLAGIVVLSFVGGVLSVVTLDGVAPAYACIDTVIKRDGSAFFYIAGTGTLAQWAMPRRPKNYLKLIGQTQGGFFG